MEVIEYGTFSSSSILNLLRRKYFNIKLMKKLLIELIRDISNRSNLKGKVEMEAYGLKFTGQGYLIRTYSSLNHNDFFELLNKEIEFVKIYKNLQNINIVDVGANLGFYSIVYSLIHGTNVVPFEPFPETFLDLDSNISLENRMRL
jgi:hypothetical protein